MNERTIIKLSLAFALIGIFSLYIIAETSETGYSKIKDIEKDSSVRMKGIVDRVSQKEKVAYVDLIQPEKISIVLFKDKEFLDIQEGDYIEVKGMAEEYEGKIQIVGSLVEKIR